MGIKLFIVWGSGRPVRTNRRWYPVQCSLWSFHTRTSNGNLLHCPHQQIPLRHGHRQGHQPQPSRGRQVPCKIRCDASIQHVGVQESVPRSIKCSKTGDYEHGDLWTSNKNHKKWISILKGKDGPNPKQQEYNEDSYYSWYHCAPTRSAKTAPSMLIRWVSISLLRGVG